jgi:RNA polymerase sigma-70 factor (ECF subfamily)
MPNLRAFALRLAGGPNGEDFAQDALAKAWGSRGRFQRGTSMKAWVFTIMRNNFLSAKRRDWRSQPLEQGVAENTHVASNDAFFGEELLDVRNAMHMLPLEQREALILAGPAGLTYEETAAIAGCAVGTVKSRISRGRTALVALLDDANVGVRARSTVSAVDVANDIIQDAALLIQRAQAA